MRTELTINDNGIVSVYLFNLGGELEIFESPLLDNPTVTEGQRNSDYFDYHGSVAEILPRKRQDKSGVTTTDFHLTG